jgi:hypothetical protein
MVSVVTRDLRSKTVFLSPPLPGPQREREESYHGILHGIARHLHGNLHGLARYTRQENRRTKHQAHMYQKRCVKLD